MSLPCTLTVNAVKGFGGGPATLMPLRSKNPLWQGHQNRRSSGRYCTVQSRCVHRAEKALYSPESMRTTIPGVAPKGKIFQPD